jgi:hypothetical protein
MAAVSENAIWERLIQPERGILPLEAAQFLLGLAFGDADVERIRDLVERNRQGTLSPEEATELQSFRQVSFPARPALVEGPAGVGTLAFVIAGGRCGRVAADEGLPIAAVAAPRVSALTASARANDAAPP